MKSNTENISEKGRGGGGETFWSEHGYGLYIILEISILRVKRKKKQ